jgi:hypothetical protein
VDVQPESAVEQRLGDQQSVRGDDEDIRVDRELRPEPIRLEDGDAMPYRDLFRCRRRDLASAAARGIRSRQQCDDVVPTGEALPRYPMTTRGRSVASASRRASGVVRSIINTPSR